MSITEKTRKILWGKAARLCSICRENLIEESKAEKDTPSIIGDECHIVSKKPNGPRYIEGFPEEKIDSYENLILLCKNHHKLIDDQEKNYLIDKLKKIKFEHEKWISKNLINKTNNFGMKLINVKEPKNLVKITHGGQIGGVLNGVYAFEYAKEKLNTREEVDAVGDLLSYLEDFDVIFADESGLKLRTEIEFELTSIIERLDSLGLWVFGGKKINIYEVKSELDEWPIGIIHIYRKDNSEIFKIKF